MTNIVDSETNEEVIDDDGNDDHKNEEDNIDDDCFLCESVRIFQFTNHHGNDPEESFDADLKWFFIFPILYFEWKNHEDEGEAEEAGDVDEDEEYNFFRYLRNKKKRF